ncbi:response regulator transcription factor [Leifsonia sp. Leaf264]|uniref:response regulator transcription factor n=1 Tax=Leifsonia sp. Leaf264 TaxID=1736314 RepID=UPI0006FB5F31|nr:response regulator transcription factor [Leifsonia sp. Leaf264]KQO99672.1 LuxR family transcriptional regulator [Leifsonia sp. Leaf264]
MTRVVVVDDHPVFRRGLSALLSASGVEIVGEAASGNEAILVVDRTRPDLVLMDLGLPDIGGIEATERITARHPDVRVIVISLYDDENSVRAALDAGALGYLAKDSTPEQIIAAVQAAEMGASMFGPGIRIPGSMPAPESLHLAMLTRREKAIAELLGKGLSNPVIAERLGLSAKTVANYVSIVLLKLGAENRSDAVALVRGRPGR